MKYKDLKKFMALSMVLATGAAAIPTYAADVSMVSPVAEELTYEQQVMEEVLDQEPKAPEQVTEQVEKQTQPAAPEVQTPEVPAQSVTPPSQPTPPSAPEQISEVPVQPTTPPAAEVPAPEVQMPATIPETPTTPKAPAPAQTSKLVFDTSVMVQSDNLRFKQVEKKPSFVKMDVELKEATDEASRTVGTLNINGVCYILETEDDWFFVESGDARGFLHKDQFLTEKETERMLKVYETAKGFDGNVDSVAPVGVATVKREENKAYYHTKTTITNPVIEKKYALSTALLLNVREGKGTDSRIVGQLPFNTLCYKIADADQEWIFVESGDVRGFVHRDYIIADDQVNQMVVERGEEGFAKANQIVKPEENKAWFYTTTSVVEGTGAVESSSLRKEIVTYASQYLGNPYVWGGTDPVNGADCSGFVQSIYRDFGIQLPRVAADQAYAGKQVPVEQAQPGDLIFYMDDTGYIYHVVMYAGNGTTVEAMSSEYGITTGRVMPDACWAVSLL